MHAHIVHRGPFGPAILAVEHVLPRTDNGEPASFAPRVGSNALPSMMAKGSSGGTPTAVSTAVLDSVRSKHSGPPM